MHAIIKALTIIAGRTFLWKINLSDIYRPLQRYLRRIFGAVSEEL
jgi:hypothetical protein